MSETIDGAVDNTTEEIVIDLNAEKTETPPVKEESKPTVKVIPAKSINELTEEERKILIDNARAGIDNPNFNVKLFKNGNARICKAKKPTLSQQIISNNGERVFSNTTAKGFARDEVHDGRVYMTDNQLMWEHIFELENKYNTLYTKHKKLKAKYNDLYIEDEDLPVRQMPTYEQYQEENPSSLRSSTEEPVYEQQQQEPVYEEQPQQTQPAYQNVASRRSWRSMILNR